MDLFTFLVITILLCALILLVQGDGNRPMQILAVTCIALEVIYILMVKKGWDPGIVSDPQRFIPCVTGVIGLYGIFRTGERSIPLLVIFASLLQFFLETRIIQALR